MLRASVINKLKEQPSLKVFFRSVQTDRHIHYVQCSVNLQVVSHFY